MQEDLLYLWHELQDAAYASQDSRRSHMLGDAAIFIKLNYKCEKGTVDDSNRCGGEKPDKSMQDKAVEQWKKTDRTMTLIGRIVNRNESHPVMMMPVHPNKAYNDALRKYITLIKQDDEGRLDRARSWDDKFDALREKHGYVGNAGLVEAETNPTPAYAQEKKALMDAREKDGVRAGKEFEYFKLQQYKAESELERSYFTASVRDQYDAEILTYGKSADAGNLTKCTVYKMEGGPTIVQDKNSPMDVAKLYYTMNKMPASLREPCNKIEILQYSNPDNDAFAKLTGTPGFKAAGCANGRTGAITLFEENNVNESILAHELAHLYDYENDVKSKVYTSGDPEWRNAISEEGGQLISAYAASYKTDDRRLSEDFADTVGSYVKGGHFFAKEHPARIKVLDKFFQDDIDMAKADLTKKVEEVMQS